MAAMNVAPAPPQAPAGPAQGGAQAQVEDEEEDPAAAIAAAAALTLIRAVQSDDLRAVRRLLDSDPALLHTEPMNRPGTRTPLMMASLNGYADMVLLLLSRGASVDKASVCGWSPLRWACANGRDRVASILLTKGADAAVRDYNGWSPLMHACAAGHLKVVLVLLRHEVRCKGRVSMEQPNYRGETALHRAAAGGHAKVAWELLTHGAADLKAVDHEGKDARRLAMDKGHVAFVEAIDLFEAEVARFTLLAKARACVEDGEAILKAPLKAKTTDATAAHAARLAAAPRHLTARVQGTEEEMGLLAVLPRVVVGGEGERRSKRVKVEAGGEGRREAGERLRGVAEGVLWTLNADVYSELLGMLNVQV